MTSMNIEQWLLLLCFGSIVGILGQFLRVIAGLKKVADQAAASQTTITDNFDNGRFFRSILIGSVAGSAAAFSTISSLSQISHESVLGIMAAGYVGADFVEAFVARYIPEAATTNTPATGITPQAVAPASTVQSNLSASATSTTHDGFLG